MDIFSQKLFNGGYSDGNIVTIGYALLLVVQQNLNVFSNNIDGNVQKGFTGFINLFIVQS